MTSVIVVDDDPDTVDVFREYLAIKGIDVIGRAYNGKEAVELYLQLKPDVVFCDVMMPEYDGFYALEKIRRNDPDAKVIMVTADIAADTKEKLIELKATAVIYKPYDIDNVIETMHKVKDGIQVSLATNWMKKFWEFLIY